MSALTAEDLAALPRRIRLRIETLEQLLRDYRCCPDHANGACAEWCTPCQAQRAWQQRRTELMGDE